ncbi:hypothetical protein, partial [Nocardia pseudovaccinii]|uniref:hypothetical protein n=1 Tax=Nocardia pseudovaccinii TaxID=189540 RepID=UPI0007A37182
TVHATTSHLGPAATMPAPYRALLQRCAQPQLISDVAAELGWPLARLWALVDDMADLGLVMVCPRAAWPGARPTKSTTTFAKIVIAGGCGTGKTTLITSLADQMHYGELSIAPTSDDAAESLSADSLCGEVELGRINLANDLVLFLVAAPNHCMRHAIYDELAGNAIGAVVLVDLRRPKDSFDAIDYFESRGIPFVVAISEFDEANTHPIETIRKALRLGEEVPVLS